jgi:hypothetical protein
MRTDKDLNTKVSDKFSAGLAELLQRYPDQTALLNDFAARFLDRLAKAGADEAKIKEAVEWIPTHLDDANVDGFANAEAYNQWQKLKAWLRKQTAGAGPMLPELKVALELTPKSKWKSRGNAEEGERSKLGGSPDWVQMDETPVCSRCRKSMVFIAQIDSLGNADTPLGKQLLAGGHYVFGDAGMLYLFWCAECNATGSVFQCA